MTEKNILAYFKTPEEAEAAASKLRALRVIDMRIDRIGEYPGAELNHIENPINGDFSGLGALTLNTDFSDRSAAILAAADVDASGMSDGHQGGPTGRDILLTAVVDEQVHHQALRVVEEAGGMT